MREHDDPVDAVILAFLDHLEGAAPRPTLDHLAAPDRERAEAFLDGLMAARGLDPHARRPSVESLLTDTPLAGLLVTPDGADGADPDLVAVQQILSGVDGRARVEIDADDPSGATVVYSYLDLRARFLLVAARNPTVTAAVRARVRAIFDHDPDTSRVGVVAAGSADLVTQVLAPEDVADTITTPRGEPHTGGEPPLPLPLAGRRMLEQSAPEWPTFDFDQALSEPFDVAAVAAEIAGRVIQQESTRSYRGDKRRAYRALTGHERIFADLVARVATHGAAVDLDAETTRIAQAAA